MRRWLIPVFTIGLLATAQAQSNSVEIDLQDQRAYLIQNGRVVLASPISSGRLGHHTKPGRFKVIQKERRHYSNLYGKIVDWSGNTVVSDADSDMPLPRGCRFVPAPMPYFIRFDGATGLHAGYLPGYPASHGCVRMPEQYAIAFFRAVEKGTPVNVFGRTPRGGSRDSGFTMQQPRRRTTPRAPWSDPRFDNRYRQPLWWR